MKSIFSQCLVVAALQAAAALGAYGCTLNPPGTAAQRALRPMAPAEAIQPGEASREAADSDGKSIVGLWKTTVKDKSGAVVDEAFETFFADGNELMVDTSAPATDNVCNGIWTKSGAAYKVKHPGFTFDMSGNLLGTVLIRTVITLNAKGDTYQGTATVDARDNFGNLVFHGDFNVQGTRITAD